MLTELMPSQAKPLDPLWTTNIMSYELGAVIRGLVYAHHRKNQTDDSMVSSSLANSRINLADLITQCQLLAEQMDWKWADLVKDGRERFYERMSEIEEGRL